MAVINDALIKRYQEWYKERTGRTLPKYTARAHLKERLMGGKPRSSGGAAVMKTISPSEAYFRQKGMLPGNVMWSGSTIPDRPRRRVSSKDPFFSGIEREERKERDRRKAAKAEENRLDGIRRRLEKEARTVSRGLAKAENRKQNALTKALKEYPEDIALYPPNIQAAIGLDPESQANKDLMDKWRKAQADKNSPIRKQSMEEAMQDPSLQKIRDSLERYATGVGVEESPKPESANTTPLYGNRPKKGWGKITVEEGDERGTETWIDPNGTMVRRTPIGGGKFKVDRKLEGGKWEHKGVMTGDDQNTFVGVAKGMEDTWDEIPEPKEVPPPETMNEPRGSEPMPIGGTGYWDDDMPEPPAMQPRRYPSSKWDLNRLVRTGSMEPQPDVEPNEQVDEPREDLARNKYERDRERQDAFIAKHWDEFTDWLSDVRTGLGDMYELERARRGGLSPENQEPQAEELPPEYYGFDEDPDAYYGLY